VCLGVCVCLCVGVCVSVGGLCMCGDTHLPTAWFRYSVVRRVI